MSSKKQRARIGLTVSQDNLIRQVEQLQDELNRVNLHNLVLQRDADEARAQAARHLETIHRLGISNEHFRLETRRLRNQVDERGLQLLQAARIEQALQRKWENLWDAYQKTCKKLGVLLSVAGDVYDFLLEGDHDPHVRRFRRVLKVLGAYITSKEEMPTS